MYQDFAKIYDEFMQTVPYSTWADYIETVWEKHNCTPKLVFDLACGTGSLTLELSKRGYEMIGADLSPEMLEIAREKAEEEKQDILYLLQDMREFELYGTVDSIVCTCDSLNYLLEEEELLEVFRLVENYLDPKGLFVFDMNTEYKHRNILGNNTFNFDEEEADCIWQNTLDESKKRTRVSINIKDKQSGEEYSEAFYECFYSMEEIEKMLKNAGLTICRLADGETYGEITEESQRYLFMVKKEQ